MFREREMWGRGGAVGETFKEDTGKMCLQGRYVLFSKVIKYTDPRMKESKSGI